MSGSDRAQMADFLRIRREALQPEERSRDERRFLCDRRARSAPCSLAQIDELARRSSADIAGTAGQVVGPPAAAGRP